jgi:L-alanine-DL-glutamate epimerase-like enolase superfamily enzyme
MFIRVEASNGLVGYGPAPGTEQARSVVETVIGPFLTGRTLADTDALRVRFLEECGRDSGLQKLYGSVEIALYDLIGKEQGRPVSELLGGRIRDRVRLYASAGMHAPPEKQAEEAHAISQLGFRAYKLHSGMGPDQDLETARRVRAAVGADFDLIIDAHTWWQIGDRNYLQATIEKLAGQLAEYNIAWLEEPLPPDSHTGYRRLKELDLVPLASGVHEPDEPGFLDLILTDSVDYLQFDLVSQGGYPAARRMLGEISRAGLKLAFHSWGTALEVIAAAQLGVCWPDQVVEWLEYPCYSTSSQAGMYPFPLAAEVLTESLQLDHGDLILSQLPGLGVQVDESVIERYPWIPGPWAFLRTDSPAGQRAITGSLAEPWSRRAAGSADGRRATRQAS